MFQNGASSLHVTGAKFTPEVQMDTNASTAVHHLKQELVNSQEDNRKLTDQLNCLVSLIKRSWTGDYHATVHLSNIIGLDPPMKKSDGTVARPNSQADKTFAEQNWERLTLKLLDHNYQQVQAEILEYQRRYLENRQMYMDAVLQDHHSSMSRVNLHRRSEPNPEDIDNKFIKHNKALQRYGLPGVTKPRAKSAVTRRPSGGETMDQMDISLRELVGETPSSDHFVSAQSGPRTIIPTATLKERPQSSFHPGRTREKYDDPTRYTQTNMYGIKANDPVRKPRPVSASSLKDADAARSRPRSGRMVGGKDKQPVFVTQKNERPLKYETTRPIIHKPKSAGNRRPPTANQGKRVSIDRRPVLVTNGRTNGPMMGDNGEHNYSEPSYLGQEAYDYQGHEPRGQEDWDQDSPQGYRPEPDMDSEQSQPPFAVRIKSAHVRRPAFIDEFADDETSMINMEKDFKKTALSLQKRLGIEDSGVVFYG